MIVCMQCLQIHSKQYSQRKRTYALSYPQIDKASNVRVVMWQPWRGISAQKKLPKGWFKLWWGSAMVNQEFQLKNRLPRQRLIRSTRWKNNNIKETSSRSSPKAKFLVWGFELTQEIDLQRIPLTKNVAMLTSMSFFIYAWSSLLHISSPYLGCSVNPDWRGTHFITNHIAPFL